MIQSLKQFFDQKLKPDMESGGPTGSEHAVRLATAALLVETARSDFQFDLSEREVLESIIKRVYGLSEEETAALIRIASAEVEASISLDQFTRLLDRNLNPQQKRRVMALLWEVAFADGRVDKYEEYLIRKLADLLHVPHHHFIQEKLKVADRLKGLRRDD